MVTIGNGQKPPRNAIILSLLIATWSFSSVILNNAYTGGIVSNLVVPNRIQLINSVEELGALPPSSLGWIVRPGTNWETLFMVTVFWLFIIRSVVNNICVSQRMPMEVFIVTSAMACVKIPVSWWNRRLNQYVWLSPENTSWLMLSTFRLLWRWLTLC